MKYSSQGGKRSRGKRSKVAGIAIALLFVLYTAVAPRLNERFNLDLPVPGQAREVANQAAPDRSVPEPSAVPEPSRSIPDSVPDPASASEPAAEIPTGGNSPRSTANESTTNESTTYRDTHWLMHDVLERMLKTTHRDPLMQDVLWFP